MPQSAFTEQSSQQKHTLTWLAGQSTQSPGERNLGSPAPASSSCSSSTSLPHTATTAGHKTHEAEQDFTWPFMLKLYIRNKSIYAGQRSPGWRWERHCETQSKARSAHPQHFISFSTATLPMHVTATHIKTRAPQPQQARGKDWGNTVKVILTSLCHL